MKIDKESTMNTSKRDKSTDKGKSQQDKAAQKEKEKKEKEKLEKEKKKKAEKESSSKSKGGDNKSMKKSSTSNLNQSANVSMPVISAPLTSSATASDINKFGKQQSQNDQLLLNESTGAVSNKQQTPPLTSSKSENVLSIFKKQTSTAASSNKSAESKKNKSQKEQLDPSQTVSKGRFRCQVVYLDESVKTFDLDKNAIGDDLMTQVCGDLDIEEREYFSLTYRDVNNMKLWLDHDKKIKYQLKGNINTQEPVFSFEVKFYPPEPHVLQEEITKYLLTLQLRHDIMDGKLPCTFITLALLGSYTAQAELGDYDDAINNAIVSDSQQNINGLSGFEYLEQFCFAPNQMPELLAAIAEFHKDHKGQTPAEAEQHYLENAVKLAMYGVDLHNAKDSDGVDILIGVSASGLLVFRDHLRINRFAWPKILKISYKRNHFYLKLRPGEFEKYETTIGFRCPNHKAAKRLWKLAVEHHAFFRLREPEKAHKSRSLLPIPTFNQKFRYTGSSTYMQSRHRSIERSQPQFPRSFSKSMARSVDHGLGGGGGDISTPGSVQSAAANHYNKMKPHASVANIPNRQQQQYDERDEEDAGDYTVDDGGAYMPQVRPPPQQQQQQPQQQYSNRSNNNNDSYTGVGLRGGPSSSGGSSNTPSNSNSYQYRKPNTAYPPNLQLGQLQQQQYGDDVGDDQVEDYYTSVDRNYEDNGSNNRTPSSIKRAIINASNLNQVLPSSSSPNNNNNNMNNNSQPASQRYVPPPQLSQRFQSDQQQQQQPQYSPNNRQPYQQQQQFQLPVSPRGQQQQFNLNKSFDNLSLNQAESDSVFTSSTPNYAGTPPPLVIPPPMALPTASATTPLASSSLNSFKAQIIQQSKKPDLGVSSLSSGGVDSSSMINTSSNLGGTPRYVPPTSSSLSSSNTQAANRFIKPEIKPKPSLPLANPPPLPRSQPPQPLISSNKLSTSSSSHQISLTPVEARLVKEGIPVLIASSESQSRTITRSAGVSVSSSSVNSLTGGGGITNNNSTTNNNNTNSREDLSYEREKLSFVEKIKKFEKSYVVNKDQYNQSPNSSYYQQQQQQNQPAATTSVSSIRSVNFADQQQQVPQPQARGTLSSGGGGVGSSITSSRMPVPQQRNQIVDQQYRTASNNNYQLPQSSSQSASSIRQQSSSSILNNVSYNNNNNAGGGGSSSTTEVTRMRKQIVFNNEDLNQKDLILKALEVATELDPNLEVEKVEISTDE